MAKCASCSSFIIFGGVKEGRFRFCGDTCFQKGRYITIVDKVPAALLDDRVKEIHQGDCPACKGSGPVDVHTSYLVWSALLFTSSSSKPELSCRKCGVIAKIKNGLASAVFGWWGFPWGLIFTPIQVLRNIIYLPFAPNPNSPSKALVDICKLSLAQELMNEYQAETEVEQLSEQQSDAGENGRWSGLEIDDGSDPQSDLRENGLWDGLEIDE